MEKTAVFTIISKNYWAFALTLHQSLAEHHPQWDRYLLLVDRPGEVELPAAGLFQTVLVEELALPEQEKFLFRYGIMELNTAVKPYMFAHLRQAGYGRVVYLDPDIQVLAPLLEVEERLRAGATAVLTPHLTAPLTDTLKPSELEIMRAGVYNLGFLAVGATPQADALLQWWQNKLEFHAEVNFERGLFTDQKWMDLTPGLFAGMEILRDPGYNVAYWNLSHRPLSREGDTWLAGGRPLRFFHFSGINPENPAPFSKHQNRFDLESLGVGKSLVLAYVERLLANGHKKWKGLGYAFATFAEGTPIPEDIRILYRESPRLAEAAGPHPFRQVALFAEVPQVGLPPIVQALLLRRPDVRGFFPDPEGRDYRAVLTWFLEDRGAHQGVAERFLAPLRQRVAASKGGDGAEGAGGRSLAPSKLLNWGGGLEYLHCRWYGAAPSLERRRQYQSVRSGWQFLTLAYHQIQRYFLHKSGRLRPRRAGEGLGFAFAPAPPRAEALFVPEEPRPAEDVPVGGAPAPAPARPGFTGINVIGYVRSEHGLGQSPRVFSSALEAVGLPQVLVDFNVGNSSRIEENSHAHLIAAAPCHPVNVFHVNADQMPLVRRTFPADFFQGRYNIGYWAWELPEFPDQWLDGFAGLDEVWVPASFVQDAISRKSPVPVLKIPHAIGFSLAPHLGRAHFALPEKTFLFLAMYDFSSYQERKNPKGALDAFDRAFGKESSGAALVIKTQNSQFHPEPAGELKAWLAGRSNVIWIDRTITRDEVHALEAACDCYLSLHRAEGFGLGLAEAMFLGKPVIGTNWSGNTDFMRQDNSLPVNYRLITIAESVGVYEQGQVWADPDLEHAAWWMRRVVAEEELRDRIGRAARASMAAEFSPARVGALVRERLRFLAKQQAG